MGFSDNLMIFFNSFKKSFNEELKESKGRQKEELCQRTNGFWRFDELESEDDMVLLSKLDRSCTSEEEKKMIEIILRGRGYIKSENGKYFHL